MANLSDYQKQIDDFLETENYDPKYWTPHQNLVHLMEEVGEIGRLFNAMYGPKTMKPGETESDLEGELGDVLFALICIANQHNISLDSAIKGCIDKAMTRDLDRFPRKND